MLSARDFLGGDAAALCAFFDDPLADVRLSVSDRPRRFGCLAFAAGNRLDVAPEALEMDQTAKCALAAHEIAHVLQQRAGRIGATASSGVLHIDPALEREADALAALFVGPDTSAARRSAGRLLARSRKRIAAGAARSAPCCQPVVSVGAETFRTREEFETIWSRVEEQLLAWNFRSDERTRAAHLLYTWVVSPRQLRLHQARQFQAHDRRFRDVDRLARALLGRVRSAGAADIERRLAIRIDGSRRVRYMMRSFITDIRDTILKFDSHEREYWQNDRRTPRHLPYYQTGAMRGTTVMEALEYYGQNNASVLHTAPLIADVSLRLRRLIPDGIPFCLPNQTARRDYSWGERFTVEEHDPWVYHARKAFVRLGAGPSATIANVMRLAIFVFNRLMPERQGSNEVTNPGDVEMMTCVALALFAFWNIDFRKIVSENHTYHEVMVVVRAYIDPAYVPYDPRVPFEYPLERNIPA